MAYYIIDKLPVFLSWEKHRRIREELFPEDDELKAPLYPLFPGDAAKRREIDRRITQYLLKKYRDSPDYFMEEYFNFDLIEGTAQVNAWQLINDYCEYFGQGYGVYNLSSLDAFYRSPGLNALDPLVFAIEHDSKPRAWWKSIFKNQDRVVSIVIIRDHIRRIKGNLLCFDILLKNHLIIQCSKDLVIYPQI